MVFAVSATSWIAGYVPPIVGVEVVDGGVTE
jgi:hypothetical protein